MQSHVSCSSAASAQRWRRELYLSENVRHIIIVLIIHRTMKIHRSKGAQCPLVSYNLVSIES